MEEPLDLSVTATATNSSHGSPEEPPANKMLKDLPQDQRRRIKERRRILTNKTNGHKEDDISKILGGDIEIVNIKELNKYMKLKQLTKDQQKQIRKRLLKQRKYGQSFRAKLYKKRDSIELTESLRDLNLQIEQKAIRESYERLQ